MKAHIDRKSLAIYLQSFETAFFDAIVSKRGHTVHLRIYRSLYIHCILCMLPKRFVFETLHRYKYAPIDIEVIYMMEQIATWSIKKLLWKMSKILVSISLKHVILVTEKMYNCWKRHVFYKKFKWKHIGITKTHSWWKMRLFDKSSYDTILPEKDITWKMTSSR